MIEITEKKDCCGCYACIQVCPRHSITMSVDEEGFDYPSVDTGTCINCGLCNKVCPQGTTSVTSLPLLCLATKHNSKDVQLESSSGGAFSQMAEQVLLSGGVVFGAAFDNEWNVVHRFVESVDELYKLRMSKYVQSRIGNAYREAENFLKTDRNVLFAGTPCQVKGLKLFLRKEYKNLLTVDFVCHGVPSHLAWKTYLNEVVNKGSNDSLGRKIQRIQFRNKCFGWEKFSFVLRYKKENAEKEISETLLENPYLRGFIHDLYLRYSCYYCNNKSFRSGSDITMCDFWGVKRTYPDLYDSKGLSGVTINTKHGAKFVEQLSWNKSEVSYQNLLKYNPSFEHSVSLPPFREYFFKCTHYIPFKYSVFIGLTYNKVFRILKNFISVR
ncbi:MAG: Coenzyme F420 hydrogenase/dehydrogenase, beta subunit C-terminal domain [Prevotella sp.]|nr:Coenzyme F420 hydrogenase/dehydrogenase, beta subunit C-terminal domain [Prevotella sp.]